MPNKDWHKNAVRSSGIFVKEIADALPSLISILVRLGLLYLFFWYLIDFTFELWTGYCLFAVWVVLAAVLTFALTIWKVVNSWQKFDLDKDLPATPLSPFILLNLIPIIAVAVSTWYAHYFGWGLLQFTQYALKRIASVL
jgi:hypothetical protein